MFSIGINMIIRMRINICNCRSIRVRSGTRLGIRSPFWWFLIGPAWFRYVSVQVPKVSAGI